MSSLKDRNVALIITIYNRPEYVQQCYAYLSKADLSNALTIIVDDASTEQMPVPSFKHTYLKHTYNAGIKSALQTGIEWAIKEGCNTFINLDGDAIVKPNFITELLRLKRQHPDYIISGFNSFTKNRNPVISEHEDYYIKQYANGINLCFGIEHYNKFIKPNLLTAGNWDYEATRKTSGCIVAKPSLVQHIGFKSSMGHRELPDYSFDFKQYNLPDVTLFGVDCRNVEGILRSAEISSMNIQYGETVILTERLFSGHDAYSDFCINRMPDYIHTSHALIIHHDGYVLNPDAWQNDWLEYDYIGAPWEWYKDDYKNGNGGFNLRSKKLMDTVRKLKPTTTHPEDSIICRELRPKLEKMGIKFAPVEVCRKFSIEAYMAPDKTYRGQFGFHGRNVDMSSLPEWARMPTYHKPRTPKYPPIRHKYSKR